MSYRLPPYHDDGSTILADARRSRVTLFGAGGFARALFDALVTLNVEVEAFVISAGEGGELCGRPVIPLADLPLALRSMSMWVAVFNRSRAADLGAIWDACKESGVNRVLLPQHYFELVEAHMGWRFWLSSRAAYQRNAEDIALAYSLLTDDQSRCSFDQTLRFRMQGGSSPRPDDDVQYFPKIITEQFSNKKNGICFVDGGAYDGDTLVLARKHLNLQAAWAFEPDLSNFRKLAVNAGKLDFPVTCFPCGLSAKTEIISFSAEGSEGSSVCPEGGVAMQAVRLDDGLVGHRVDYLKLDVEGHELQALEGARATIVRCRPVLAIAAYHRWDDLWKVPLFIRELGVDYKLLYRTHESNTFDSVFYACLKS